MTPSSWDPALGAAPQGGQPARPLPALELGHHVARRLYPATLLVVLLIGAGFPGIFLALERASLAESAARHARDLARDLEEAIVNDPPSWRPQAQTHLRVVGEVLVALGVAEIRIEDRSGHEVASYRASGAHAWLDRYAPGVAAPIVVQRDPIGRVHVKVSQVPGVRRTGILLLVSASIGGAFLLFIRGHPIRYLHTMERRIQELLETIRRSNLELERRARGHAAIATENARLYEGAQRTLAELQAKNTDLSRFIYTVSHDLKTPLVALQGMTGALLEDYGDRLDVQGRHFLDRVQANVQQMERLLQDLLAISRVDRDGRPAEPVHLSEVFDDVLTHFADALRDRGIKVIVHDTGTLWGLRAHVQQVLANLVGNAIKYMGEAPQPTIELGVRDCGAVLECHVRDTGIGIDPAYHDKVFELFQRLHDIEAEGTGVGLAIVKKIVEGAGGRIWVESARGQGATFRFTWPTPPPGQATTPRGSAEPASGDTPTMSETSA